MVNIQDLVIALALDPYLASCIFDTFVQASPKTVSTKLVTMVDTQEMPQYQFVDPCPLEMRGIRMDDLVAVRKGHSVYIIHNKQYFYKIAKVNRISTLNQFFY